MSRFLPIPDALHAYAYGCDITEALIVAILWLYSRPASREFIGAALEARNSPTSKRSIQRLLSRLSDLGLVSTIGANKSIQYYATEEAIALFPNHPDGLPKSALTLRAKNAPQASLSDSLRAKNAPQMSICAPKTHRKFFAESQESDIYARPLEKEDKEKSILAAAGIFESQTARAKKNGAAAAAKKIFFWP